MRAIEDGLYQSSMKIRLADLKAEKACLVVQQAHSEIVPNVPMRPNLAAVYRKKVEELESLLDDARHKDEAAYAVQLERFSLNADLDRVGQVA